MKNLNKLSTPMLLIMMLLSMTSSFIPQKKKSIPLNYISTKSDYCSLYDFVYDLSNKYPHIVDIEVKEVTTKKEIKIAKKTNKVGKINNADKIKIVESILSNKKFSTRKPLSGLKATILNALDNYEGPNFVITSTLRNWGGPDHRVGKAIDIHYDEDLVFYLLSDKGQKWLNENHLEFFIEDAHSSSKDDLPGAFLGRWRHIPWATGLHLHLNIK